MKLLLRIGLLYASFLCPAMAQESPAENAPLDANTLVLDTTGTGFLSSGNGTVLERGQIHIQSVFHHLDSPIIQRYLDDRPSDQPALLSQREQLDLALSLGVWHRLQLSARVPLVLYQDSPLSLAELPVEVWGWADPELGIHAALLDGRLYPVQLGFSVPITVPIGRSDAWMSHGGWTAEPRLNLGTLHGPVRLTSRIGYRFQPDVTLVDYARGDRLRMAAGVSWIPTDTVRLGLELMGEFEVIASTTDTRLRGQQQGLELLAGSQVHLGNGFDLTIGAGPGLTAAVPTPQWRAFGALSWTMQAIEPDPCRHLLEGQPLPPECPDPHRDDLDQDGILNIDDACPVDPEDIDGLLDADGCPELDADGDLILDPVDICPLEPETVDGVRDEDGCPDDQLVALTQTSVVQLQRVTFEFARATITTESEPVLWAVLELMRDIPSLRLQIEGHTDNVGSDAYNSALSVARARACYEWLIRNAEVPEEVAERLEVLGHGELSPTDTNRTQSGMAENRRVEFVVLSLSESASVPIFRAMLEVDRLPQNIPSE